MLPFVLLVTPVLIRAASLAFPSLIPEDVRLNSLKNELPQRTFSLAFLIPGLVMILVGLMITLTPLNAQMIAFFKEPTTMLVQGMFYVSGTVLTVLGLLVGLRRILNSPKP